MNRLFGSKNTAPKPTLTGAISNVSSRNFRHLAVTILTPDLQLDTRIESVDVQLAKVNAELMTFQQRISKMRDGPGKQAMRQKAMKVLQRRKMYETQKDQLEQQSWNMQQAGMMQDNLKSRSTVATATFSAVLEIAVVAPLLLPWKSLGWEVVGAALVWVVLMWWRSGRADVMVTVDAMKTTNKELKKQYGKVNIDKSKLMPPPLLDICYARLTDLQLNRCRMKWPT